MFESAEKKCIRCKKSKALNSANFAKNKRSPDGFCSWCKECQKIYRSRGILDRVAVGTLDADHKKRVDLKAPKTYELHGLECTGNVAPENLGIQDWSQIDSALREMAELRYTVNKEKAACEKRISLIKNYTAETITPRVLHLKTLYSMLQNFLNRSGGGKHISNYRFGSIHFLDGQLKIRLNLGLAKQRMGKP